MAKNCFKKLTDENGETYLNTLVEPSVCEQCILQVAAKSKINHSSVKCPIDGMTKLVGGRNLNKGQVLLCGTGYGKNTLFDYDLDCLSSSLSTLARTKADLDKARQEEHVARIRRVLHNIRSINGHSLQEMRALVPEHVLKRHKKQSCDELQQYVKNNVTQTSLALFRISKDLYEIKSEFSVYDKLIKGQVNIDKRYYNVRDVIMLVLYPFFEDFRYKNVVVNVEDNYTTIPFDFETLQVAFYHIIENSAKYIRPNTDASIEFEVFDGYFLIRFSMDSLFVDQSEVPFLFKEGYSGEEAKNSRLKGDGIGLYRAKVLIELNGGSIRFIAGEKLKIKEENGYGHNEIIIELPMK